MKTFQKQLTDQLDYPSVVDGVESLSFLGCSISGSDVLLLQSERPQLMALKDVEFAHCRFDDSNNSIDVLAQLLASLSSLQSLSLVDNLQCSIADISMLIRCSQAATVRVRPSLSTSAEHDASDVHPLEVLLSACTQVRNLRIYLPTRRNGAAAAPRGLRPELSANQLPPLSVDHLTRCIHQYLSNLQYLMWNGLGATNLENVTDWCKFAEGGFLRLPSLKALWLENILVQEDFSSIEEEQAANRILSKLVRHISEELTLVQVSPSICSSISQCLINSSLQELNLHRVQMEASEFRRLINTTLSSRTCQLPHLGLRQIRIHGNRKYSWRGFCDSVPKWSHLKSLDISGIHSSDDNLPIQPPDDAHMRASLQKNTLLTSFYVDVEGCRAVTLPFHLAERNFQLGRAERWLEEYRDQHSRLAKRPNEQNYKGHYHHFEHGDEEDIYHRDTLWPVMLQSLNTQPSALHRLVVACAATEWNHFERLSRKRKPSIDLK